MSEFVFNDIYGNESARNRYKWDNKYAYYNTVLQMHNRYFENNNLHQEIFNHRKSHHENHQEYYDEHHYDPKTSKISRSRPRTNQSPSSFYSMEKINNLTFRINKSRRVTNHSNTLNLTGRSFKDETQSQSHEKQLGRSIIKDA